jgi:hypothetical protein
MGFPLLPQLSATAELFIVNLVTHHDPQPDPQIAGRCDPGFAHSFLDELAPMEAFQLRVLRHSMHRRFGPQVAQQCVSFQPDRNPFFAIVGRDGAQIFVKSDKDTSPLPNPKRSPSMRWDTYVYLPDPDALVVEFADHGAAFSVPLKDTHDGLRGFEICDPDGYVLFFGRPR